MLFGDVGDAGMELLECFRLPTRPLREENNHVSLLQSRVHFPQRVLAGAGLALQREDVYDAPGEFLAKPSPAKIVGRRRGTKPGQQSEGEQGHQHQCSTLGRRR